MTQIVIPPVIEESQLLYSAEETKQILVFFFPVEAPDIEPAQMTKEIRCFAQSLLICAIDSSFAMGFVEGLFRAVANPKGGIKGLARRLATNYLKHWWRNTSMKDLEDARVYETVRATISRNFRSPLKLLLIENSASVRLTPFSIAACGASMAWV